jgi:hypothetical protein
MGFAEITDAATMGDSEQTAVIEIDETPASNYNKWYHPRPPFLTKKTQNNTISSSNTNFYDKNKFPIIRSVSNYTRR